MTEQYTLDEIKKIVYSNMVSTSNLTNILSSLKDYDFNDEIRSIFTALSKSQNLPETIRINFKNIIDSYDEISKEVKTDGENSSSSDTTVLEDTPKEIVFEEPTIETITELKDESKEEATKDDSSISLENDAIMGGLLAYASFKGINVISSNPGINDKPQISFELTYESKPYIDHLLLELYGKEENVNVEMSRIAASGKEVLSLSVDDNLSEEELKEQGKKLFTNVNEILRDTDEKKDYESLMPSELKNLKDKFVNDDPNIPDKDFKVGFKYTNGEKKFFLVADSKEEALEISKLMGYDIKEDRGGNVFELDTADKKMTGTKLDKVTEDIDSIDEVKDAEEGISDVDIDYNSKHYADADTEAVIDFIEESKDPDNMSVVQIDVPTSTPSQRVVNLASADGTRRTIVFNNGKDFDNYTLPKVATAFGEGTTINRENTKKIEYDNGKSSYDTLSSDNTYLRMNNFDSKTVDEVDNELSKYMDKKEETSSKEKNNSYVKTLGTYPVNTESAKISASTLIVFAAIVIIGIVIVCLTYGG